MAIFTGPDGTKYSMSPELAQLFSEPDRHEFETKLISWAEQCLKPDGTFLDIGAHVGTWALPYAKKVKRVVAIEANPQNYFHLCAGIALNDLSNVEPFNAAAGDRYGSVTLNVGVSDWSGFGGSVENFPINGETKPVTVMGIMIDTLDIRDLCLVKIDVEGHEKAVLMGMTETLMKSGYPPILFEAWSFPWFEKERKEVIAYVESLGYRVTPVAQFEHMWLATYPEKPAEKPVPVRRTKRVPTPSDKCLYTKCLYTIFSMHPRPDTTGGHLERALVELLGGNSIIHREPLERIGSGLVAKKDPPPPTDFLRAILCIDDDHGWPVPDVDVPIYYWCIDSYRMDDELYLGGTRRERIRHFDKVFYAQKADAEEFGGEWLPLAVDTKKYRHEPLEKIYDWCFIGNMNQTRGPFLDELRKVFPKCFVGNAYDEDANRIYNQSKLAINLSAGRDVNMRMFEAQATSALLLSNQIDAGESQLFKSLALFRDTSECIALMQAWLAQSAYGQAWLAQSAYGGKAELRDAVAKAQADDMREHTYEVRARQFLSSIDFPGFQEAAAGEQFARPALP